MTLKEFHTRFLEIFKDKRGELDPTLTNDITKVVIDGVTFILHSFYKTDGTATIRDKIQRLIDKDANCS